MPAHLRFDGLAALKDALRQLPEHLRDESRGIVHGHVDAAETTIRASYAGHRVTGRLDAGLQQNRAEAQFGVRIVLRNRAPHAWLFDQGSKGPRRGGRGVMPAADTFIPAVQRARAAIVADLVALLRREGLTVSGG